MFWSGKGEFLLFQKETKLLVLKSKGRNSTSKVGGGGGAEDYIIF